MSPSPFDEHRDALYEEVDAEFAEPLRVFVLENGRSIPGRGPVDIDAVLRTAGRDAFQPDGGNNADWNIKLAAGKATLAIDRTVYPELELAKGFRVCALSRKGQPMFEVVFLDVHSHRRLYAILGEVQRGTTRNV
ncbi:hypothetical protein F9L06_08145 [Brucella anthropi]|uniref:Uncharacterized protein n=1 Tax=Brucella anthropi TaxID=529 RepID=A0A6I0DQ43_BRUAN|nr:hypothetical protein [Brucella anthropi]KAB2801639.1 hypothetical protein F9L06_08145 [Brucella anthropi]